jgi:nicotinamidase-related amidase
MAEVLDSTDPSTAVNSGFVQALEEADILILAGEALSHCVCRTVTQVADCFKDPKYIQKMVLMTDCCSNVPGFEFLGDKFIQEMTQRGMKLAKSTEFMI